MPAMPNNSCGKKVTFTPTNNSQKLTLPSRSLIIRPVTFGNQ
jgi:hypothetical protein